MEVEAEGAELRGQVAETHDLVVAAVDLQAVPVDEDGEVIQVIVGGGHEGLPDLALLQLAVAAEDEDTGVLAQELGAQRHAVGDGDALAQGAGGGVHAGELLGVGMALEPGVELTEGHELLPGEEALLRQHAVVAGGDMALGEDEAVPVLPVGVGGVHPHGVIESAHGELHCGERAAGMPAGRRRGHLNDVPAHLAANGLEFLRCHG